MQIAVDDDLMDVIVLASIYIKKHKSERLSVNSEVSYFSSLHKLTYSQDVG